MSLPLLASWGLGVNSTAMIIGMVEHNEPPDFVISADTKAEKPESYEFRLEFEEWMRNHNIAYVEVSKKGETLEDDCLRRKALPSVAYGWKTCSDRYKRRPIQSWIKAMYGSCANVRMAIGIDAGEQHRVKADTNYAETLFPLIEWGWSREECVAAIKAKGLSVPIKSACFFCPNSRKSEVLWLALNHPELYGRAVAMEHNAELTTIKGLGRRYSWEQLVADKTLKEIAQPPLPCMCFDGEE